MKTENKPVCDVNTSARAPAAWQAWFRRGLLALLVLAAGMLWLLEGNPQNMQEIQPEVSPLPTARQDERLKRENAYERDVAALQELLESGAADEVTRQMAAQKLAELISEHQHEIGLETALLGAGYENAVVLMQNGAVTVMLPQERLNEETSAQILELCVIHAGVGAENIRMMGRP